jgi:hypothetical protein
MAAGSIVWYIHLRVTYLISGLDSGGVRRELRPVADCRAVKLAVAGGITLIRDRIDHRGMGISLLLLDVEILVSLKKA